LTIRPSQVKSEIFNLLKLLTELKPKIMLEIGTELGGTLFLFSHVSHPAATIISIDLPFGPFGGGYPEWKIPLYRSFVQGKQRIFLLRCNSHSPETLKAVREILKGRKLDFLFIDGDHTYEGVKKDFEMYFPLVRKGGMIALHDIVPAAQERVGGVPNFWREIRNRFSYLEIVEDWNQGGYGIGIIFI
jgi:cephalosporin hydroxylase